MFVPHLKLILRLQRRRIKRRTRGGKPLFPVRDQALKERIYHHRPAPGQLQFYSHLLLLQPVHPQTMQAQARRHIPFLPGSGQPDH